MVRPLTIIAWAILLSRPSMPEAEAMRYAKALQRQALIHDFDPLTGVAIIHHESGWHSASVSANGEDYGLSQIRARYIGACKQDRDPLRSPSRECVLVKQKLLDPEINIETMASLIAGNREFCKKKTGTAKFHQWLASYQGRNYPAQRRWCKPGDETWTVIRYRQRLLGELSRARVKREPSEQRPP